MTRDTEFFTDLLGERAYVDWRLEPGDAPVYRRDGSEVYHADHACPRLANGSRTVKVLPLDYISPAFYNRPCERCTI